MHRKAVLVTMVFMLVGRVPVFSQFFDLEWGASQQQVIAIEGRPVGGDAQTLAYLDKAGELDAMVVYRFANDSLTQVLYQFGSTYSNGTEALTGFLVLNVALEETYGESDVDRIELPDQYLNEPDTWPTAIELGHAQFAHMWATPDSQIVHHLSHDGEHFNHALVFVEPDQ